MARDKQAKRAKAAVKLQAGAGERQPKAAVASSDDAINRRPVFSFELADTRYAGGWSWPTGEEAGRMLQFLCEMGRLTWGEIRGQQTGFKNRHRKHHDMPLGRLGSEAGDRLVRLRHNDTFDVIFRFRVDGKTRLWGFVIGHTFYVLWWDATHGVYPTDPD